MESPASPPLRAARPHLGLEALLVAALLLGAAALARGFLAQRTLPGGDEGTWMAPAARLLAGEGFTTNWLVMQDLEPYALPRPDDHRFPALVILLALVFAVFGKSYAAALGLMLALHLAFLGLAYLACRRAFGVPAALVALALAAVSPLQLGWNTYVYCESLFGAVLAGLLLWTVSVPVARMAWWWGAGAGVGLLCLVKLHALLFVPGLALVWLRSRRGEGLGPRHLAAAGGALALVLGPWLVRNAWHFGNPLHVGHSAWIFRFALTDPKDLGLLEFVDRHGPLVFLKKLLLGMKTLFQNWDGFDEGLARVPLLLAFLAALRRAPFFNLFAVSGFALLFLGSAYTNHPFWIGIRFWSPLVPFVVAYGVAEIGRLAESLPPARRAAAWAGAGLILVLPAAYPLRYHLRQPSAGPVPQAAMVRYVGALERHVPPGEAYMAGRLGQLSFLTDRNCLNLDDEFHVETWVPRMLAAFSPRVAALAPGEDTTGTVARALAELRGRGYAFDTVGVDSLAVFLRLRPLAADPAEAAALSP